MSISKTSFTEGELEEISVVRKFRTTTRHRAIKGKTQSKESGGVGIPSIVSNPLIVEQPIPLLRKL